MIFQIKGKLVSISGLLIILDVAGIGYGLSVSMNTLSKLPEIGKEVLLYTHVIIKEESHVLYGFLSEQEKLLFCELIKISGFGPKHALSILSHLSVTQFLNIIMLKQVPQLTNLPGIGNKIAQRLIVEIGNNINNKKFIGLFNDKLIIGDKDKLSNADINNTEFIDQNIINDAQEALKSLGYNRKDAITIINKIVANATDSKTRIESSEQLLKAALKNLSKMYHD